MHPPTRSTKMRPRAMLGRLRYLFLLATVCGCSFLILSINSNITILLLNSEAPTQSFNLHRYNINISDDIYTIKTEGCTIPGLKPFDESINRFIKRPNPVLCPKANISLIESNNTHIWIQTDMLTYYDVPKDGNFSCCYESFYRPVAVKDVTSRSVDDRAQYEPCIEFTSYIEVMNEFVKVSCNYQSKKIYEQFFLFALKKPLTSINDDNYNVSENRPTYNVIVMGTDAISRLNFYRTMPKTLAYLKKKGAIELLGYNKVGDNTFPNLIPMLLGIKEEDLKRTCWPHTKATFDNCPFIWEWYKEAGYYTALAEDNAKLGNFNYGKMGFIGTPTDYYSHTFMKEAEKHVGNTKDYNSFLCMGDRHFYKVLLDYIEALTNTLRSSRLFGFFWEVTLSHDYLNYPMLMDDNYVSFFQNLEGSKYLDDTIFILLSDHGIRWGDIRYTRQGRLEERLPFVYILLPPSFKDNYTLAYNNLKLNSRQLTTPFDVHATLLDLINLEGLKNEKLQLRTEKSYAHEKSVSLFLPLPTNRTCKVAEINDHWCTCHKSGNLSSVSPEVQEASVQLVKNLNSMLHDHRQCSNLTLAAIIEASEIVMSSTLANEEDWREIMVVIQTLPGNGVFEATMRRNNQEWALIGTVSRLNLYGDQSHCVDHYELKLYCYCL